MIDQSFIEMLRPTLGADADRLAEALEKGVQPVSVRLNQHKPFTKPTDRPVAWASTGCYLPERPSFTLDPHFQAGAYYVQEASSMFVEELFRQAVGNGFEWLRVLDMCAAPGGKSTIYSTLVGDRGIVVANEVIRQRALTLSDNIQRWGVGNTIVTNDDPSHFAPLEGWFDVVAVDAPCSGEGMFRKSQEAREQWSPENVRLCAARQKRILADAWNALREGGLLIYSTCTFNREENEENMEWLATQYDCETVHIDLPEGSGIVRTPAQAAECFHFYPHLVEGEGFFAAVVRKGGSATGGKSLPKPRRQPFAEVDKAAAKELSKWIAEPAEKHFAAVGDTFYSFDRAAWSDTRTVCGQLGAIYSGVRMGQLFGRTLKPDHALALSVALNHNAAPNAELPLAEVLHYLRREELTDVELLKEGINLITFEGQPVGWTKRIGRRTNNLMPKEIRILQ